MFEPVVGGGSRLVCEGGGLRLGPRVVVVEGGGLEVDVDFVLGVDFEVDVHVELEVDLEFDFGSKRFPLSSSSATSDVEFET
jgi:hypothetical protein